MCVFSADCSTASVASWFAADVVRAASVIISIIIAVNPTSAVCVQHLRQDAELAAQPTSA